MTNTAPKNEPAYVLTTIGPWAAALGARRCAGDDLLDELRAVDMPAVVIDAETGVSIGWLELVRRAHSWSVRLPAPGDPDGIPPGPAAIAASAAGEAIVVQTDTNTVVITARRDPDRATHWLAHRIGGPAPAPTTLPLGQARLTLLDAVGEATSALAALPGASAGESATLRTDLAAQVATFAPLLPPDSDGRAAEVAALAAQVLGTVALAAQRRASFGVAGTHAAESDRQLSEVAAAARRALGAAVNRVIEEFGRAA